MATFEGYERREAKILSVLKEYGINITQKYRILLIRAAAESPSDNLSLLEQKIHQFF